KEIVAYQPFPIPSVRLHSTLLFGSALGLRLLVGFTPSAFLFGLALDCRSLAFLLPFATLSTLPPTLKRPGVRARASVVIGMRVNNIRRQRRRKTGWRFDLLLLLNTGREQTNSLSLVANSGEHTRGGN